MAHDSADVWAHPEMYHLDESGQPTIVAGVPPDYFSPTGQLWGNPIYRWDQHAETGYAWWIERFRAVLRQVRSCAWITSAVLLVIGLCREMMILPKMGIGSQAQELNFFEVIEKALGGLPIIAEDLGEITPDVIELRDKFSLPGMKILQFGLRATPSMILATQVS